MIFSKLGLFGASRQTDLYYATASALRASFFSDFSAEGDLGASNSTKNAFDASQFSPVLNTGLYALSRENPFINSKQFGTSDLKIFF
ncbi:hypothetical protein L596_025501 [Steinernema carpocapsae]|uniref:Uncharacterized protein n=1 Tax=Steinernema carpocapsae TaxID=34508 RepID=A0A4U5M7X2_STECR|nr:hypothetical protein L596_025501 [Steinernema carpocapsae]